MVYNEHAHKTFWYWIAERYRIFKLKEAGLPKPWSQDPIFQQWKFCNVFRQDDTQTRWFLKNIVGAHTEGVRWTNTDAALLLFNIYAFRAFNWYETYDLLRNSQSGWIHMWNENSAKNVLLQQKLRQEQLTSGAYMIRGRQGMPKYESIPQTLTHIWAMKDYLLDVIQDQPITTLEEMQELLMAQKFYGWGPFTTYQVVLDMTYTRLLENAEDLNSWCEFGPGAKRGIRCIWPDASSRQLLPYARQLFEMQDEFRDRDVPVMTLQDIEFCLCELSKYLRIERGGRSKATYAGT